MTDSPNIDSVIAPIASSRLPCPDALLDLRESILRTPHPGKCVACFFKILGSAQRQDKTEVVSPLRHWLEAHLEVVAEDESQAVLERLPVNLREGQDLEDYCHNLMAHFHHDRAYATRHISLRFAFKDTVAA